MRRTVKISIGVTLSAILCLALFACKVNTQQCAAAVNRYANALSTFQDAEIALHGSGQVTDVVHIKIIQGEQAASKAGHDLDAAINLASTGADPSQFVTLAQQSFDAMVAQINVGDPATQQKLILGANAAGDALKNAISLIEALRDANASTKPSPVTPASPSTPPGAQSKAHGLSMLWAFMLLPIGGIVLDAAGIIALLQIAVQLEPEAFSLITNFATSLKGKSAADLIAMNETLFNKVDATAEAQLAPPAAVPSANVATK